MSAVLESSPSTPDPSATPIKHTPWTRMVILTVAFLNGFVIMSIELLGGRVLAPYFGSSVHVWGSIIAVFMLSLSLGYLWGGRLSLRRPGPRTFGAFFVLAYPTDEKEDMKATVKLAARLGRAGIDDVSAGFFFPLPNTEITRQLEDEGKVTYDDAFLQLPIYVHNKFLSEDRKYNEHFTAKQLTRWKYKTVAAFYFNSFLFHPTRVFKIMWNFLRGKEASKMDSFLQETKRKFRLRKKPKKTSEAAPAADAKAQVPVGER